MLESIIDGDFFRSICDISLGDELPNKQHVIIYVDIELHKDALRFISDNTKKTFTLVTHNSDLSINVDEVPENLVRWYTQNLDCVHPRISPLPIGLENKKWHPMKKNVMKLALKNRENANRKKKALCQFNPVTFRQERQNLLSMVLNNNIYADPFYCLNGVSFEVYADNLTRYEFCLCPRGNGIDTHRMWESILLGCIPIAKKHITHFFDMEIPVVFIDSWLEVDAAFLEEKSKSINRELFETPILTKTYWENKILGAKCQK
jgi:hypothetical protein